MARFFLISVALCVVCALSKGPRLPVPEYQIDLDVAPEHRFNEVIQVFNASIWRFYDHYLNNFLAKGLASQISKHRGPEIDELQREIQGAAAITNIPEYGIHAIQMFYELVTLPIPIVNITWPWDIDSGAAGPLTKREIQGEMGFPTPPRLGCTGIIAMDEHDGTVYHARNLDFSYSAYLQNMTYVGVFTRGGKEVFRAQMIAAYSSVTTGMRKGPNGYSLQINTRFLDHVGGYKEMFHNLFTEKRNFSGWTKRKVLENSANYEDAVAAMSNTPYASSEYNIIGGVKKGTILARNADGLAYQLNLGQNRYIIMTNFDYVYHDIREWFDASTIKGIGHPRRIAAEKILNNSAALTPEVLFGVLNDDAVMAKDTIFQAIMNVETGLWNVSLPACVECGRRGDHRESGAADLLIV